MCSCIKNWFQAVSGLPQILKNLESENHMICQEEMKKAG